MLQNFIINYRIQGLAAGAIQKVLLRTAYCTYVDSHMWGISNYNPSVSYSIGITYTRWFSMLDLLAMV